MKLLTLLISLISMSAQAHVAPESGGIISGLSHPLAGLDHFSAMLLVGMLSVRFGKKHIFAVPGVFMLAMVFGAIMALYSTKLILVEFVIALSIAVLGIAIYTQVNIAKWIGYLGVFIFGYFHGFAHGTEIPRLLNPGEFICGFLIGTLMIHLIGVVIAEVANKKGSNQRNVEYIGAAFSGIGIYLTSEYLPLLLKLTAI